MLDTVGSDWQDNAERGVATTKSGEAHFNCVYPKLQKKWVEKPIYEEKSYQFVEELMRDAVLLKQGEINVAPLQGPVLPANIAPTPCGNKQEIIDQYMSSFH